MPQNGSFQSPFQSRRIVQQRLNYFSTHALQNHTTFVPLYHTFKLLLLCLQIRTTVPYLTRQTTCKRSEEGKQAIDFGRMKMIDNYSRTQRISGKQKYLRHHAPFQSSLLCCFISIGFCRSALSIPGDSLIIIIYLVRHPKNLSHCFFAKSSK